MQQAPASSKFYYGPCLYRPNELRLQSSWPGLVWLITGSWKWGLLLIHIIRTIQDGWIQVPQLFCSLWHCLMLGLHLLLAPLFPFSSSLPCFLKWWYFVLLETLVMSGKSSMTSQPFLIYWAPLYSYNWSFHFQDASLTWFFLPSWSFVVSFLSLLKCLNQSWSVRKVLFCQINLKSVTNYQPFLMIYHCILDSF